MACGIVSLAKTQSSLRKTMTTLRALRLCESNIPVTLGSNIRLEHGELRRGLVVTDEDVPDRQ